MASIVLVERLRNNRIAFEIVVNNTVLGFAEPGKAFQLAAAKLANLRLRQRSVAVVVEGRLGRDAEWKSFGDYAPSTVVRKLFCGWYTQAVQAQAALVKQQISPRVSV